MSDLGICHFLTTPYPLRPLTARDLQNLYPAGTEIKLCGWGHATLGQIGALASEDSRLIIAQRERWRPRIYKVIKF